MKLRLISSRHRAAAAAGLALLLPALAFPQAAPASTPTAPSGTRAGDEAV